MIEAKNLTKRYGPHTAVDGLTFTIREGQVYGFLGPNGAGKTTTMNMLTGYLPPTEGTVLVDGHDITEEPLAAKRFIGYMPEVPPLYPGMTVREYLAFAAEMKGLAGKPGRQAAEKVMEQLALGDMRNRLIRNLSKGYRQRVGMAEAIIADPGTLILDEPTAGLDPRQIAEIRSLIKTLGKDHTILLSSHILPEVSEICDTVLILSHGKIAAEGDPKELAKESRRTRVSVLTDGKEEKIRAALSDIAAGPALTAEREGELLRIHVTKNGSEDLRAKITEALVRSGCAVYEIKADTASLEDIFLEMTEEKDK